MACFPVSKLAVPTTIEHNAATRAKLQVNSTGSLGSAICAPWVLLELTGGFAFGTLAWKRRSCSKASLAGSWPWLAAFLNQSAASAPSCCTRSPLPYMALQGYTSPLLGCSVKPLDHLSVVLLPAGAIVIHDARIGLRNRLCHKPPAQI